jgi:hypothetical protein
MNKLTTIISQIEIAAFVSDSGGDPSQYTTYTPTKRKRLDCETIDEILARARATKDQPAIKAGRP